MSPPVCCVARRGAGEGEDPRKGCGAPTGPFDGPVVRGPVAHTRTWVPVHGGTVPSRPDPTPYRPGSDTCGIRETALSRTRFGCPGYVSATGFVHSVVTYGRLLTRRCHVTVFVRWSRGTPSESFLREVFTCGVGTPGTQSPDIPRSLSLLGNSSGTPGKGRTVHVYESRFATG